MLGFAAYVKRIFFGPSSQNLIAGHQVTGGGSDKELLLDPSTGPVIRIPADLPTPSERNEKPREYWTLYNQVESHYKRGRYDLAKSELVELETISTLHPASRVLRLRTYRKLIAKEKKRRWYPRMPSPYVKRCSHFVLTTSLTPTAGPTINCLKGFPIFHLWRKHPSCRL